MDSFEQRTVGARATEAANYLKSGVKKAGPSIALISSVFFTGRILVAKGRENQIVSEGLARSLADLATLGTLDYISETIAPELTPVGRVLSAALESLPVRILDSISPRALLDPSWREKRKAESKILAGISKFNERAARYNKEVLVFDANGQVAS